MSGSPGLAGGAPHRQGSGTLTPRLLGGEPRWEETPVPGPRAEGPKSPTGVIRAACRAGPTGLGSAAVAAGGEGHSRWTMARGPSRPPAGPSSHPALPHRVCKVGAFHNTQNAPQLGREGGSSGSRGRGRWPSSFSTAGSQPPQVAFEGRPARGHGQIPWRQGAWGPGGGGRRVPRSLTRAPSLSGGCLLSSCHRQRRACGVTGLPARTSHQGSGLPTPLAYG